MNAALDDAAAGLANKKTGPRPDSRSDFAGSAGTLL